MEFDGNDRKTESKEVKNRGKKQKIRLRQDEKEKPRSIE
jgi:hypothetical protein